MKRTIYVALGVNLEGEKECLGLWINETEGAKFWLSVLTELKERGVEDIFIACVDGLTGFPGDRSGVPENSYAALHRPHGAPFAEVCDVERSQSGGR